jgi:hypothetical protein
LVRKAKRYVPTDCGSDGAAVSGGDGARGGVVGELTVGALHD